MVNPMTTRQLPHYWTPDQVARLLGAMPAGQPWLFALLLWRTALRQGEALKLEWRDLNFAAASPTITVRDGKVGRSRVAPSRAGGRVPFNPQRTRQSSRVPVFGPESGPVDRLGRVDKLPLMLA